MLKIKIKWLFFLATILFTAQLNAQEWTELIDENLSQWELWMGIPHVTTGLPGATSTTGINGGSPLGLNNDPLNVFSVINEGGELQLKITGEVYGGLTTLAEYADYHLSMEFKWGEDKYEPRLTAKRDSGILYHCKGDHGSFWSVWKSCLEMQVQETDCGDFYGLSGGSAQIQSVNGVFSPGGDLSSGNIKKSQDFEYPNGEWNTLEVITVGDKSMHFVNGNLVNALENTTYNGAVLKDGQIQIQSEGAEVYYRNIKIKSVTDFPAEEKSILGWDGTDPGTSSAPIGSVIRLQKSGGDTNYVTVSSDGNQLIADTSIADEGAEFTVEAHPSGGIGLKHTESGKYLQVQGSDTSKPMKAFGNALGTWEQFEWKTMGTGKVALQSSFTGTWVQANYGVDNSILYPVGLAAGTWETFNFEVIEDKIVTPTGDGKVLVFYKTLGFSHSSIDDGIAMITKQGEDNGLWETDSSDDSGVFTTANLAQYDVVVWCNTTGDNLLTSAQEAAFEQYIRNGGGFVGIHSATDTYRNGDWPFYNDLVGAIVQTNPYHTSSSHNATMTVNEPSHPTVDFLGSTWNKTEEYYYWKNNGGYLYDGNVNLLTVESTGNNDYDEARPISWYKEYEGGRSFYTALGHNDSDYTEDSDFIKHVEEGIIWAANFDDFVIPPTSENLALNGTASQSSTAFGGEPERAIDGNTNGIYFEDNSVTHTATEDNAWWQVELSSQEIIGTIDIYNRVGCCQDRLSNFTVIITDDNDNETFRQTVTTIPNPSITINAENALGKIIRIQSNLINNPLSLAEVEVYAGEVANTVTRIEAEDFDLQSGTQTEASSEGTDNVGWIENGNWLMFSNINLTGIQSFNARVACAYAGGTIEMHLGSPDGTLIGSAAVVNTGGNQVYETVSSENIESVSGVYDIYFVFTGGSGYLFNVNWFELLAPKTEVISTRIEAEDYDDEFDIQTEASSEGTDNVGWINNGNWLMFSDINLTGIQSFNARVACDYTGGTIEMHLGSPDGTLIGSAAVVNTGGNQVYETVSSGNIESVTGIHDVYFVFTGGSGFLFNVNWFELSSTTTSSKDIAIAQEIKAEVYPNPSEGLFTIENVNENANISIYNISGQAVNFIQTISGTTRQIDIQSLVSGMYIVYVNGRSYSIVKN